MKFTLSYWKFKDKQWTRVEKILTTNPDDTGLNIELPIGVDLDTVTLIKTLDFQNISKGGELPVIMPDWDGRISNREHPDGTTD